VTDILSSDPTLLVFVIVGLAATLVSILRDTRTQARSSSPHSAVA
jgi:F0F1-type ATP synthase assembly protein I